jgi:enoyl-CoA hydratase/carnithine racemase
MRFKTTHMALAGDRVSARIAGACLASVVMVIAICLMAAPPAFAEAPSAQDQYLEVVPDAGGSQSPQEFSRSLGGNGGPVTRAQIERLARQNARRRGGSSDSRADRSSADTDSAAPANLEAVAAAASKKPLSGGFATILALAIGLTAAAGLLLRRRARA